MLRVGADIPLHSAQFPIEALLSHFEKLAAVESGAEFHLACRRHPQDRFLVLNDIQKRGLTGRVHYYPYFDRLASFPLKKDEYDLWIEPGAPLHALSPSSDSSANKRSKLALFVTPFHPSKHEGNSTLIRHWLRHLRSAGWRIHLLYYGLDKASVAPSALAQARFEFDLYREVPVTSPLVGSNENGLNVHTDDWCGAELLAATDDLVAAHAYDAAIVHYPFASAVLDRVQPYTRRILVMHDSFADRNRRMLSEGYPDAGWVSLDTAGEALALSRAETIVALQQAEADQFRRLAGEHANLRVIGPVFDRIEIPRRQVGTRLAIGYCGSSNWVNEWNLVEYMKRWIEHPTLPRETEIVLAGGVSTTLDRFAPVGLLDRVRPRLLGRVDDLRAFFAACDVVINPERGGTGIKIKSLEAMAAGMPLLTTRAGSVGTGNTSRWHMAANFDELVALTAEVAGQRDLLPAVAAETVAAHAAYSARNRDALAALLGPLGGAQPLPDEPQPTSPELHDRPAMRVPDEVLQRGASYHPEEFEKFFARVDVRGKRVLEIGSDFHLASARLFLANGAREVIATNIGNWHAPDIPEGVTFRVGDVADIDLGDEGFDIVYGIAILEHLPDAEAVARAVKHHLKPGGIGYLQGCPLWTGALGHHVYVSPHAIAKAEGRSTDDLSKFDTTYSFAQDDKNPIPHWSHLSMNAEQMTDFLATRGLQRPHAIAIADHVYDRHGDLKGIASNFKTPTEIISAFRRHLAIEVIPDRWFDEENEWARRALDRFPREDLETLGLRLWVTREDAPIPAVRPAQVPRVSVIVPMYNVEAYLAECLHSLLGQDFADLEVIVVDDASPDGSRAVAEAIAAADGRVRIVVHPVNMGLGPARNTGALHARGEYLLFLDSDDRLTSPDALGSLVFAAERSGCEVVVGSCATLLPDGSVEPFDRLHDERQGGRPGQRMNGEAAFLGALYMPGDGYLPMRAWGTLIARRFYERLDLAFPAAEHEDLPHTPFLYHAANGVWYEPRTVVHYRRNAAGLSRSSWSAEKLRRYAGLWQTMKANLARFGLSQYQGDAAVKYAEHLAWKLEENGVGAGAEDAAIETFEAILRDGVTMTRAPLVKVLLDTFARARFLSAEGLTRLRGLLARLPARMLLDDQRERLRSAGVKPPAHIVAQVAPQSKAIASAPAAAIAAASEDLRTNEAQVDAIMAEYAADASELAKTCPSMLTEADRAAYWHAARHFRFSGSIVDSGCFVGGTTHNLVDGLRKNPRFSKAQASRLIRVYDLFRIDDDYIRDHLERIYPGRDFSGQASFLPIFEKNLADARELLDMRPGDVTGIGYPDREPIELFGVDLCKAEFVTDHVVREFFPRVMEGGLLLQQDWIHEFHPHIHLSMLRLDDHFERHTEFKWGGTVAFTLKKTITPAVIRDRFGTDLAWYGEHAQNAALLRRLIDRSLYEENRWILTLALGIYHRSQQRMDLAHAAYREACHLFPRFEPSKLTREMIGE